MLDDQLMTIERIGLRSTAGKTGDGIDVLVPNSTLASSTVKNLTRDDQWCGLPHRSEWRWTPTN